MRSDPIQKAVGQRMKQAAAEAAVKRRISELKRQETTASRSVEPNALLEAILPMLPEVLANWEEEWEADRQGLTEAFIASIEVRCVPTAGKKRLLREVTAIRWQPWLDGVMD